MQALVKIGYNYYLVRNATAAAAVINGMAGAIQLRNTYNEGSEGRQFYPEPSQDEVGMITVKDSQILPCKPGEEVEADCETTVRRHGGRKKMLQLSDQPKGSQ